jgi:hypothetical protein
MESSSVRTRWQPPFRPLKTSNPVRRDLTVAPATHKEKEKSVQEPQSAAPQTAPQPKVTLQDIRALIIAKPGIKRNDIYKTLVFADGSNKKKVGDLISCLISSKQVTQTDENGEKTLHVGPGLNDALARKQPVTPKGKAEAKEKAHDFKLLAGEDAEPLQQASFPVKKQEAKPAIPSPAPVAVPTTLSNPTLAIHLTAIAEALPGGVILGIFRDKAGKMEFTLDTSAGATFNMGESIVDVANGIHALAALQPFAEH